MAFSDGFKSIIHDLPVNDFESAAIELFDYQWNENAIYQEYCKSLKRSPSNVKEIRDIPFIPIAFFKEHQIQTGKWTPETTFLSSGTTKSKRSQHLVASLDFYLRNSVACFEKNYGSLDSKTFMALLPSYQEQGSSSLIAMVHHFMQLASTPSKFYLNDHESLLKDLEHVDEKFFLIGVSFALLDFIERYREVAVNCIIMETGGMKGRRKELIRQELHRQLEKGFGVGEIHSEYGMTELFSQAYAKKEGVFQFPSWARVYIRDINDPFSFLLNQSTGGINIIDLANVDTCAFIETMDLGKKLDNSGFEVLGRFDNSDVRGCNLLI